MGSSTASSDIETIKFAPIRSFVDSSFFHKLSELKLNEFKLDSSEKPILAVSNFRSLGISQTPSINLSINSFESNSEYAKSLPKRSNFFTEGFVHNVNTIEEFKKTDKSVFLKNAGNAIYQSIISKSVLTDPQKLSHFSLLTFSDLKKYKFYYWFAFPSLHSEWSLNSLEDFDDNQLKDSISNWLTNEDDQVKDITLKSVSLLDQSSNLISIDKIDSFPRDEKLSLVFIDTSSVPQTPSVVLRNYLTMLAIYGYRNVKVTVFRFNSNSSFVWDLTYKGSHIEALPKVTGWERTSQLKLGPKLADLGSLIDPIQLADQAVDLNLKLMKWRIAPELNLDVVKETKCLLLGSGTLGSYVSRALLGWGIRNITFVDNGRVSFSNPVRQPLFEFEDCLNGGELKALKAAETLKKIFPLVNSEGYNLEVPMAGHPVTNEAKQKEDFDLLVKLVEEHDAIFLLMDSRETRWLPTILGNVKGKIVMNAALGFDSYLVMRHGNINENSSEVDAERLGCYFCNDVVAPSDSLTDRTLDQMCTVTRPGVALIASALAVELLVSILQHPDKQHAKSSTSNDATLLGSLPHQIRGFLHHFDNVKLSAPNYKYCSACSLPVLDAFKEEGWEFVKKCLDNSKYVEKISGLEEVQKIAEEAVMEFETGLTDEDDEWM